MTQQDCDSCELMVTIRCTTYNHEPYIRQCLDGFLMQKTTFRFEAVVHDDASTDQTANIIREYAEKYPDIIKPIYETENQYSKHDGSIGRIMNAHMHGKYIAMCEGDDYWTDPLKLQKQVDFLEAHPDFSMCFTNAEVVFDGLVAIDSKKKLFNHLQSRQYSGYEIFKKWSVPTASCVFRNYFKEGQVQPIDNRFIFGDIILFLWLAELGNLWCINEKTVVYRRNKGGATFKKIDYNKRINHYLAVKEHFGVKYEKLTNMFIAITYIKAFITSGSITLSTKVLQDVINSGKYFPLFIRYFLPVSFKSLSNKIKLNIHERIDQYHLCKLPKI